MTRTATEPHPIFPELAGTRRFTVDEYHRLADAGILGPEDRVELLDGYVVYKADYPELQPTDGLFPEWRALRQWSRADYHAMHDAGILMEGERVELLDGYMVEKPMRNPPHDGSITRITNRLPRRLPSGWVTRVQSAVTFWQSEPEPDGAVVRGDDTSYDTRHPGPADFGIIIEVSDSSLIFDRRVKGSMYARFGVLVYWILNVIDRQVEVYADPDPAANPPAYRTRADYAMTDAVPVVLDGTAVATVPVADLIP